MTGVGPLKKLLVEWTERGEVQVSLEHVVIPESKEVLTVSKVGKGEGRRGKGSVQCREYAGVRGCRGELNVM